MGNMKIIAFDVAEQLNQLNRSERASSPIEALRILTGTEEEEELYNVGGRMYTAGQLDHADMPEEDEEND